MGKTLGDIRSALAGLDASFGQMDDNRYMMQKQQENLENLRPDLSPAEHAPRVMAPYENTKFGPPSGRPGFAIKGFYGRKEVR